MVIIKLLVASFWAVIGFFMWIPLLFRVIMAFCLSVVTHAVSDTDFNNRRQEKILFTASSFYFSGFQRLFAKKNSNPSHIEPEQGRSVSFELIWAFLFWGTLVSPFIIEESLFDFGKRFQSEFSDKFTFESIRFYESDEPNVEYNKRFYRENFNDIQSNFLNWELNIKHPKPKELYSFSSYALLTIPSGKTIRSHINTYVKPEWNQSYHGGKFAFTRMPIEGWDEGTYFVKVFVNEQEIGSKSFTIGGIPAPDFADKFVFDNIKLFECNDTQLSYERRVYKNEFYRISSRYLGYELNLKHPGPSNKYAFLISAELYTPSGETLESSSQSYVLPNWNSSSYHTGYFNVMNKNLSKGKYNIKVFVNKEVMGTRMFRVK